MICRKLYGQIRVCSSSPKQVTGCGYFGTLSAQEACESSPRSDHVAKDEYAGGIDWDNLGFGFKETDYMYVMKCGEDEEVFRHGNICPLGSLQLTPSAGVLNYGQGVIEGIKAYRREDGSVCVFRPHENAIRMQMGADRLCMPSPSPEQFVDAVKQTVIANTRWIPPPGKGSLYVRPLLIGSGPVLGLAPAPEYTFLVYASPVANYFKEDMAIHLYVEDEYHRSTRGGTGGVKCISNYAPVLKPLARAKSRGFSEILYLDSVTKTNVEEASTCNVFMLKGNVLSTPEANGKILLGITRKSIMDIARDLGYQVEERCIPIEELIHADEVFCTGTAVGVAPVGSITYKGNRVDYKMNTQLVSHKLYSRLVGIQKGDVEDNQKWVVKIN